VVGGERINLHVKLYYQMIMAIFRKHTAYFNFCRRMQAGAAWNAGFPRDLLGNMGIKVRMRAAEIFVFL
jgi:hypothetical protein